MPQSPNHNLPDLPSPYKAEKLLGKGSYGIVYQARDTQNDKQVAIKKILLSRLGPVDRKRVWREIRIAKFIRHKNINHLLDVRLCQEENIVQEGDKSVKQKQYFVYQVFDLMDTDLHKIISSPQELSEDHVKWFLYQILRGIKYLHSAGILHRDLKPSNLLVNANCKLKIADFGLARQMTLMNYFGSNNENDVYLNDENNNKNEMTKYIVTRWYRAPELLINSPHYGTRVDIWSVGCIFAELLNRRPLLRGQNYMEQLKYIIKLCGTPSQEDMRFGSQDAQAYIQRLPKIQPTDLKTLFPYASNAALDLLRSMLLFNPEKRCTVDEALAHPYLEPMRRIETELTYKNPFNFLQQFEEKIQNESDLIHLLEKETLSLHPEICVERIMVLQNKAKKLEMEGDVDPIKMREIREEEFILQECLQEYDYIKNLINV